MSTQPTEAKLTLADLRNMPLRIEIESACQYLEAPENRLRMVSCAKIYELPEGGSRRKPRLLLGPVGVPDNPDATWSELLRCLADALEQDANIVEA